MQSNYKRLGDYIQEVNIRNKKLADYPLLGVSVKKKFIPSIANTVGTDFSTYKIVKKNQFTYIPDTSRRGEKIGLALLDSYDYGLVSQAYTVFKILDEGELHPEYLMMWFKRPEFDRYARVKSHGSVREIFDWQEMRDILLPIPSPEKQLKIVKEYNVIQNRIQLNNQLITKLEETAQAIYKQWFVDFEFPDENGLPYKSNCGEMVESELGEIPKDWSCGSLGKIMEPVNGYAFKSGDFFNSGAIPIIKIKNIKHPFVYIQPDTQYYNNDINKSLLRVMANKGDILISMTGSGANQLNSAVGQVGKYYYNDSSLLNQRVCKLSPKQHFYNEYIYQFIITKDIQANLLNGSTGSANQANISPEQLKSLKSLIPDNCILEKFQKIGDVFDNSKAFQMLGKLEQFESLLLAKMTKVEVEKELA